MLVAAAKEGDLAEGLGGSAREVAEVVLDAAGGEGDLAGEINTTLLRPRLVGKDRPDLQPSSSLLSLWFWSLQLQSPQLSGTSSKVQLKLSVFGATRMENKPHAIECNSSAPG